MKRAKGRIGRRGLIGLILFTGMCMAASAVHAKGGTGGDEKSQRYILELQDQPLAAYDGRVLSKPGSGGIMQLAATAPRSAGAGRLDLASPQSRAYLDFLAERHAEFELDAASRLQRPVAPVYRYRLATNGMALDLTEREAILLSKSPLVRSIERERLHQLESYASAEWLGAAQIWDGSSGFAASRGEGMIIGIIDSGINWESPSFLDPTLNGYAHTNPLGDPVGLCSEPEVECNNKLIGVWDYVEDFPESEEVEENTNGRDIDGHGSLVASVAAGNPVNIPFEGRNVTLSGVAPRANIIVYRTCHGRNCSPSAALKAVEQAIEDRVHVLNYSAGSNSPGGSPWNSATARAFLNARAQGIFVATSAGNNPPSPIITDPAQAPWVTSVGAGTHDQVSFGSIVQNLSGGAGMPPQNVVGVSYSDGVEERPIVHARDYGFAECGVGEPELEPDCEGNLGLSNPWDGETPFNGEIVVCDRGTYGRVEKGKNVMLAGAGGYILANTDEWGEYVVPDEHCLPAAHIGLRQAEQLRDWLSGGAGHRGSISGETAAASNDFGDQVQAFSARGPALFPVQNTLKPNLIAPGASLPPGGGAYGSIVGATENGQEYGGSAGTSFSSPQVAGAAALIRSVHQDWTVSQISSVLETTASVEYVTNDGFSGATPLDYGAGRPQLGEAVNAGLFLDVSEAEFRNANPAAGGDPQRLNLAGLVDTDCRGVCTFARTVTDQMGGGSWTADPIGFPDGVTVTISPNAFQLAPGGSQRIQVTIDSRGFGTVGRWAHGRVRLAAAGSADQYLTVAVGAELPEEWTIEDDRNGGWQAFELMSLPALPDATFTSAGLQLPERSEETLVEDPTFDDPYDGGEGVFTKWHELAEGALWLHAETLASTAVDLDLFVGADQNGNGVAEAFEELCSSTSPTDVEQCDLYDLPPGNYWVLVQNWAGSDPQGDVATLLSAGIGPADENTLAVTGPGIVPEAAAFDLRLSWDNLSALPGEEWLGAVGIGTNRDSPNDIGIIPVRFVRSGIAAPATFPLFNGAEHRLAVAANATHDRLFIDVPTGATRLTVSASGRDAVQSADLGLELRRLDFETALADPPFAASPAGAAVVAEDNGDADGGPSVTVSGATLQSGRWYAVLSNGGDANVAVRIRADLESGGAALPIHRGLWLPSSRPDIRQGFDYNWGGASRALLWYSYDEDGQPAWYIAGSPAVEGNIWMSELLRVTNNGSTDAAEQQVTAVGTVSVTMLDETDSLFSFTLFGESGTDRMKPLSAQTCPQVGGTPRSYTGIWYRGVAGLGGASVLVNASTQAQIHYLFDAVGAPRWLVAQEVDDPSPSQRELPMLQFTGFCPLCTGSDPQYGPPVGTLTRDFDSETSGSWTLDYEMAAPLTGSAQRTDPIVKLTGTLDCL